MKSTGQFVNAATLSMISLFGIGCMYDIDSEQAREPEAAEEAESSLLNGTTTTDYAPVVRIETSAAYCTATAIADDLLITAAHCVKSGNTVQDWVKVRIAHGANSGAAGKYSSYIIMSKDIYDNEYIGSTVGYDFIKRDFALIKFGTGTFSSYYDTGVVTSSLNGQTVRLLGFGGNDVKEYGDDVVTGTSLSTYGYITASQSSGGSLESGDSGGPVLYSSGGTYVVIGVNSAASSSISVHPVITSSLDSYLMPILYDELPNYCVEGYQHTSYSGFGVSFCNETDLDAKLAATTFSDPFKMEEHGYFSNWDNQISSLILPSSNTIVTVFESSGQTGSSLTFQNVFNFGNTSTVSNLIPYSFNDKLSSFRVTTTTSGTDQDWLLEITRYGKCVDVDNGGPNNGAKVQQWDCQSNNPNMVFKLEAIGSYYRIKHPASGRCLDVFNDYTIDGTKIQLWDCHTGNNQLWSLSSNTSTSSARDFKMVSAASGKCMDLSQGSASNGAQMWIWTCDSNNTNQNFALKQL